MKFPTRCYTGQFFKKQIKFCFFLFFLVVLNSCCCPGYRSCPPCCIETRRPPVMTSWEDWVYDYNTSEEVEEICDEEEKPKQPITPELLDPFAPTNKEYRIAVGDILEIYVLGDEDISAENVIVAPDGRIYYAFLDGIPAQGRTVSEVKNEITSRLAHLFINPDVSVVPKVQSDQTFRILGRVAKPGLYFIQGSLRLRDAIGMAGGVLTQNPYEDTDWSNVYYSQVSVADLKKSFIARGDNKLDVDFEKLLLEADNSQNIYVHPGDYIYISPTGIREVYILGNVKLPRALPWTGSMTVTQAIASAGGFPIGGPYAADVNKVIVLRGPLKCPCVIRINLWEIIDGEARDLYLKPGDIVFVSNKTMRFGRAMVRLAINTFVQSFAVAAGQYYGIQWFPQPLPDTDDPAD